MNKRKILKHIKINKLFKVGLGYTIGNILLKCINFFTTPIFTRVMTAEEFGAYNTFLSYDTLLSIFFSMAIYMSLRNAQMDFKDELNEYVSSISLIYVLNFLIYSVGVIFFGNWLSRNSGFNKLELILLVLNSFGSSVVLFYNILVSLEYAYKKYLLVSGVNIIGNTLLSLLLMYTVFKSKRDLGKISGVAITVFIIAWIILISFYRKARPKIKKKYWKYALKYSLPLIPHGLSQVLLGQFDKIMIRNMIGNEAVGIYSLAGNVKTILEVLSTSIATVWNTYFYEKIEKNKDMVSKYATILGAFFTIAVIGMIAISPELIDFLGGKAYEEGKYIIIPMLLEIQMIFFYNIFVPSEYYLKKTNYVMYGTMMAAIINIVTNYLFIKKYGYFSAAYTTLFSYICYLIFHMIISYRLMRFFIIPLKWIIIYVSISIITGIFDIIFLHNLFVRWGVCIFIIFLIITWIILYWKNKVDNIF